MEHSAGYQEFGSNLLSTVLVELEVLGREPPREWRERAHQSKLVLEWLIRPDGSIPNFGDSALAAASPRNEPAACAAIRPGARYWPEGYFVAWDAEQDGDVASCAQATVVWSSFISNAHKRPTS